MLPGHASRNTEGAMRANSWTYLEEKRVIRMSYYRRRQTNLFLQWPHIQANCCCCCVQYTSTRGVQLHLLSIWTCMPWPRPTIICLVWVHANQYSHNATYLAPHTNLLHIVRWNREVYILYYILRALVYNFYKTAHCTRAEVIHCN